MYIFHPLTLIFRIISGEQPVLSLVSPHSLHLAFSGCITVNLKLIFVIPYGQYVTIAPKRLQCCPPQVGLHNVSQRSIHFHCVFLHYFLALEHKESLVRWSPQLTTWGTITGKPSTAWHRPRASLQCIGPCPSSSSHSSSHMMWFGGEGITLSTSETQ